MTAAVLVPVKAFGQAKARLRDVLDGAGRAHLARTLATGVVRAAAPLPVVVVCDDAEVATWAAELGATVLHCPEPGLDAAVRLGAATLAARGVDRVVVAHGDLPRPAGLARLASGTGVTIVPDRHDDGTNVLVVPTDAGFGFAYGPGSFHRHGAEALRCGLALRVVRDPALGWDVDRPEDLVDARTGDRAALDV